MQKLFDGAGNAVEAYTQAEVDELSKNNPAVQELQTKLTTAEATAADLKKQVDEFAGTDKGQNMAALRKKAEDATAEVEKIKTQIVTELPAIKKRLDDADLDRSLLAVAEGDEDLAKKIKVEYERIVKPEDTDEEKRKKMGDAYRLASGYTASPNVLSRVLGSSGAPGGGAGGSTYKPEFVALGRNFGLTPEDFEKFSKK